jgi:hypothetical protein
LDDLISEFLVEITPRRLLCNPAHGSQAQLHAHVDSGKLRCVGFRWAVTFLSLFQVLAVAEHSHADVRENIRLESGR